MKNLYYFLGLALLAVAGTSQAESLTYEIPYIGYSGSNYPASSCFIPSFKADACGNVSAASGCDYGVSALRKYSRNRCENEPDKVSITYNFKNKKLVSIDGYFGRFELNNDEKKWLEDIKYIAPKYPASQPFNPDGRVAHRVNGPLGNRLYVLSFYHEGVLPTENDIKRSHGDAEFHILEFVYKCNESSGTGSNCAVAEYKLNP